jgi:hypothetical protein
VIAGDDRPSPAEPKKVGPIDDLRLADTLEENL